MRGKRQKSHGARSGEYGGCDKTVTCCLANSSWTRTERCAGVLSCSNSQFYLCQSSVRLRLIESRYRPSEFCLCCTFWDEFHVDLFKFTPCYTAFCETSRLLWVPTLQALILKLNDCSSICKTRVFRLCYAALSMCLSNSTQLKKHD